MMPDFFESMQHRIKTDKHRLINGKLSVDYPIVFHFKGMDIHCQTKRNSFTVANFLDLT
jgi:hypothetical protein